jgi:hypothetical protein
LVWTGKTQNGRKRAGIESSKGNKMDAKVVKTPVCKETLVKYTHEIDKGKAAWKLPGGSPLKSEDTNILIILRMSFPESTFYIS